MDVIPVVNIEIKSVDSYANHVIDLSIAKRIVAAAREYGFIKISGHGIDSKELSKLMEISKIFFKNNEMKNSCIINDQHRGFIGLGSMQMRYSKQPDYKESFIYGMEMDGFGESLGKVLMQNNWPNFDNINFKHRCLLLLTKINDLGIFLLRNIALGLGLNENIFVKEFMPPLTRGSLLHYPFLAKSTDIDLNSEKFGVAAHTDYGCITLVYQYKIGGLQVLIDNKWIEVEPDDDFLIINIGDLLSRWVNGYLKSTLHRVINSSKTEDRYSFAVFIDPSPSAIIDCISIDNSKPKFKPINAAHYIISRQREGVLLNEI